MTEEITIKTAEGECMDIELEELEGLKRVRAMAKAPESMIEGEATINEETIDYTLGIVTDQSVLTEELIQELDMKHIFRLMEAGALLVAGEEVDVPMDRGEDDDDPTVEFSDDGSVDLDDWR